MKLEGKTFNANVMTSIHLVEHSHPEVRFAKELDEALIQLCREMDVPLPLWLSKNTHEFARFHQTIFFSDQYTEKVNFDRFQIRMI
ncbi:MAG TPA: hypothetical protein PKV44_00045 [Bacillota bacterium]|nr:hypothetical protein [Bacillota bacterium]HPE37921.1 hypothetical protein [Bacillota bacterium]